MWSETDHGPATKLLPALQAYPDRSLVYCDDDCLYHPGWLKALCAANRKGEATAASGWSVKRLHRQGANPPFTDIAQGFSGVLIHPGMIDPRAIPVPPLAMTVDDIWLSGMRALTGTPLRLAPKARALVTPMDQPYPLQDSVDRASDNARAAEYLCNKFGLWPCC
ncbi:hypothetical protein KUW09_03055 [Mameliella alba]|nr:hypothetical protein [Antarctobacter heliothermus]MBY6143003.1 hypothetical protein [Mameliella alba]MCA0953273.1 hypothetical protein [Mameliella alba]